MGLFFQEGIVCNLWLLLNMQMFSSSLATSGNGMMPCCAHSVVVHGPVYTVPLSFKLRHQGWASGVWEHGDGLQWASQHELTIRRNAIANQVGMYDSSFSSLHIPTVCQLSCTSYTCMYY